LWIWLYVARHDYRTDLQWRIGGKAAPLTFPDPRRRAACHR
jgi:hypothetical protein